MYTSLEITSFFDKNSSPFRGGDVKPVPTVRTPMVSESAELIFDLLHFSFEVG